MPTLHDGRQVHTNSEEWRHECEARHIMSLPNADARRDWLDKIERHRGKAEADRLRATVRALWRRRPGGDGGA